MSEHVVGVGPWEGSWPDDERFDPELLEHGDTRNVIDKYRYWRHDAIVADLDRHRHPLCIAIENWQHDFNIGSIVRTANAFRVAEIVIVGKRRWNRRGAMVTDRYQHVSHQPDAASFTEWARQQGKAMIGIDNVPGSVPLEGFPLPREAVLVFGQEGPGLSAQMRAACEHIVHITQFGSTRSMNVGAAAAIAMYDWTRTHITVGGKD